MNADASGPGNLPAVLLGKRVAVLGAGKVGSAVAMLLVEAGMPVAAVTTRSEATAKRAAERTGAPAGTDDAAAAAQADIVLITTNDDAIAEVAAQVAQAGAFRPGQLVAHMSGALPLAALAPASEAGAAIGCAHPLQSFATAEDAARAMPGSTFAITAGSGAREMLEALVDVLGGHSVGVEDEDKALYHAAAVVASNYLVAVEDVAVHLLMRAGFDEAAAVQALQPLISGTVSNIRTLGTTNALTGPIVRGDVETVREHIRALRDLPGDLALYRALGRQTLDIAVRRETLSAETLDALRDILADDAPAEK